MSNNEREPGIERTRKDVTVYLPTVEAIAEALPPTISREDKEASAERLLEMMTRFEEETRNAFEKEREASEKEHKAVVKAFEEERRKREKEHAVVLKALDDEKEGRTTSLRNIETSARRSARRTSSSVTVVRPSSSQRSAAVDSKSRA
jgi:hypothetical protein